MTNYLEVSYSLPSPETSCNFRVSCVHVISSPRLLDAAAVAAAAAAAVALVSAASWMRAACSETDERLLCVWQLTRADRSRRPATFTTDRPMLSIQSSSTPSFEPVRPSHHEIYRTTDEYLTYNRPVLYPLSSFPICADEKHNAENSSRTGYGLY